MRDNAEFASLSGFHDTVRPVPLQDISSAGYIRRAAHSQSMRDRLAQLLAAHDTSLSAQDKLFAKLFDSQHAEVIDGIQNCPLYLLPINSMGAGGPLNAFSESIEWMRVETASDANEYLLRLQHVPTTISAYREVMEEGISRGFTASKVMLKDVEKQLIGILDGSFAEYTAPIDSLPAAVLPADSNIRNAVSDAIIAIRASFTDFLTYLKDTYFPNARDDPSCSALPNGRSIYEKCLKFHTTTNLTPDEVHEIGVLEVICFLVTYVSWD